MNTQDIEQVIADKNEVMAIFDGWQVKQIEGVDCLVKDGYRRYHYELNYHCDWNRLMPIVRKIRDILQYMLKNRPPHTAINGDFIEVDIHCALQECDILKAHHHVYQFIVWYNENV